MCDTHVCVCVSWERERQREHPLRWLAPSQLNPAAAVQFRKNAGNHRREIEEEEHKWEREEREWRRARNQGEKRKERGGVGAEKEKVIDWSTISYVTRKLRRHRLHSQKYLDNLASPLFAVVHILLQTWLTTTFSLISLLFRTFSKINAF